MKARPVAFNVRVAVTAQHRQMLDQVLQVFRITPDYDLNLMLPGQTLATSTSRMLAALEPVFRDASPDIAYVQGDTTSTLCGALSAFYAGVPIGHIEAGLRTGDMLHPFPEEANRVLAGRLAALHFAATNGSRDNLLREGVRPETIHVTGNSGIDAVLNVRDRLQAGQLMSGSDWSFIHLSSSSPPTVGRASGKVWILFVVRSCAWPPAVTPKLFSPFIAIPTFLARSSANSAICRVSIFWNPSTMFRSLT